MPVTTTEIAKALGLSRQTVSYALNGGKGRVSESLRRRVQDASQALGYRPHAMANAMRTGKFEAIGLVATTLQHHSYLPDPLMEGVHQAINGANLHLVTARLLHDDFTDNDKAPKLLRELLVDGLLVNYTHDIPDVVSELISRQPMPAVWMNADLPHDAIRPDDFGAGRMATEHLLKQGHRRIAYFDATHRRANILNRQAHYSAAHRYEGYLNAMQDAGHSPRLIAVDDLGTHAGSVDAASVTPILEGDDRPTAVVTYSEAGVISLIIAAAQRGRSVPGDLFIVAIADRRLEESELPVDTVLLPFAELGRIGVEALASQLSQQFTPQKTKVIPCSLSCYDGPSI